MKVQFLGINSSEKRWYAKVARFVTTNINNHIESVNAPDMCELWADFNSDEESKIQIIDKTEGNSTYTSIVFASKDWGTMPDANAKATQQFSKALLEIVPKDFVDELKSNLSEYLTERYSIETSAVKTEDDFDDFYLYLKTESLEEHIKIVDFFEQHFAGFNHSDISGTGFGITGTNIDFVTNNPQKCEEKIIQTLKLSGIQNFKLNQRKA